MTLIFKLKFSVLFVISLFFAHPAEARVKLPLQIKWQYQLSRSFDLKKDFVPGVKLYIIDLFDNSSSTVKAMKDKGAIVICYFSAGSYEDWRSDAKDFPKASLGKNLDGWEGEKWLDIKNTKVLSIMKKRLDLCKSKGFDGADLDNMDGYTQKSGFQIKSADQLKYNRSLAAEAQARDLTVGLKNDVDQIPDLVKHFDFTINEECFEYQECKKLLPFIDQGKAVLNVEYKLKSSQFCTQANAYKFSSIKKKLNLDREVESCLK